MSDNTNLVPVNLDQLPSTQIGSDDQFADLAKSADYLGRLQLFTKGKAVNKRLVGPGNYGIPTGEEVDDLGDTIDIIPLARRPKAIDMTDNEAIIVNYDPEAAEFKRIAAKSLEKESHCMYGPSFLVFERSRGLFLEFFCGNKSSRSEAKKVYPYLPLTQADIDTKAANGDDVSELGAARPAAADAEEPAGGEGHLLVARARGDEVQHGVHEFPRSRIGSIKEIGAFLTVKDNGVERATVAADDRAR